MSIHAIRIHLGDWSVEIPEGWEHDVEDSVLLMRCPEGDGLLQFSAVTKTEDGEVTDEDLREFIGEMGLESAPNFPARYGPFTGLHLYSEGESDTALQHWFLRNDTLMLLVSYTCDEDDNGNQDAAIAEALESLRREDPAAESTPTLQ